MVLLDLDPIGAALVDHGPGRPLQLGGWREAGLSRPWPRWCSSLVGVDGAGVLVAGGW